MIFDGKKFATEKEAELKIKFAALSRKVKLAVILDPTNPGSVTYTNLKRKFGERIGVDVEIVNDIKSSQFDGIIVQLPMVNSDILINQIDPRKDVDGLREDSPFKSAAVRAVTEIINSNIEIINKKILIIGSQGEIGRKLIREFKCEGIDKDDFDLAKIKMADIIFSAAGQEALIKPDMVKEGVVAIDLGYPKGDFDPEVAKKASFFTPVPGGVGPVTVAMLFQNLLDSIHARSEY